MPERVEFNQPEQLGAFQKVRKIVSEVADRFIHHKTTENKVDEERILSWLIDYVKPILPEESYYHPVYAPEGNPQYFLPIGHKIGQDRRYELVLIEYGRLYRYEAPLNDYYLSVKNPQLFSTQEAVDFFGLDNILKITRNHLDDELSRHVDPEHIPAFEERLEVVQGLVDIMNQTHKDNTDTETEKARNCNESECKSCEPLCESYKPHYKKQ